MAASIIAKVARDAELVRLDALHAGYGLAQHKGYGTPLHLNALLRQGPSAVHRMSFAPCRAAAVN
jgi:ribonuclease HII